MGQTRTSRSEVLWGLLTDYNRTSRWLQRHKLSRIVTLQEEPPFEVEQEGDGLGGVPKFTSKL